MERWSGKVALVTGASAGIGAAIAEELVKHGLKVVALARRVEKVEELKKKLGNTKGELFPLKGDVSKEEEIIKAFEWIKSKFGTIHVLVNNAGIVRFGQILTGESQHWRDILDVNVMGLSICSKHAYQLMRASGVDDGHIILINSIVGHRVPAFSGQPPSLNMYPPSKFAVTALTETLRRELNYLKTKIRVTSISPGFVRTEITEASVTAVGGQYDDIMKKRLQELPGLESKDIADGVIYVLSAPPHVQVHELTIKPVGEEA